MLDPHQNCYSRVLPANYIQFMNYFVIWLLLLKRRRLCFTSVYSGYYVRCVKDWSGPGKNKNHATKRTAINVCHKPHSFLAAMKWSSITRLKDHGPCKANFRALFEKDKTSENKEVWRDLLYIAEFALEQIHRSVYDWIWAMKIPATSIHMMELDLYCDLWKFPQKNEDIPLSQDRFYAIWWQESCLIVPTIRK